MMTNNNTIIVILSILLLYGFWLFHRVTSRDIRYREISRALGEVQKFFACRDPNLSEYIELRKKIFSWRKYEIKFIRYLRAIIGGGLIELITLTNSIICGGLVFFILIGVGLQTNIGVVWAVLTTVFTFILFSLYYLLLHRLYDV